MWWQKQKSNNDGNQIIEKLAELETNGVAITTKELLRYQMKSSLIDLAPSRNLKGKLTGNYLARTKGRGMEFDEVRHYQPGDDIRAIDWRVTARTGQTHTKLYQEEKERPVLIGTDISSSMLFGSALLFKSVQACHLAALIAWNAKNRGDRVGGLTFNENNHQELKPRSRQAGVLHYLHALETMHGDSFAQWHSAHQYIDQHAYFEDNCRRLRQLAKPGSLVYLISDFLHMSEEASRHLTMLSRHCELVACLVSDPMEHQLPQVQGRTSVQLEHQGQRSIMTLGDSSTETNYQKAAKQFHDSINQQLTRCGARLIQVTASDTLESQLKAGLH